MNITGLGLAPGDPCYDPNHPWYDWLNLTNTDAECACLEASGVPLGQQCATFQGVIQTMTGQAGSVVGGAASAVGEGIGTGVATGVGSFAQSVNLSGIMLLAIAGGVVYMLSKR